MPGWKKGQPKMNVIPKIKELMFKKKMAGADQSVVKIEIMVNLKFIFSW